MLLGTCKLKLFLHVSDAAFEQDVTFQFFCSTRRTGCARFGTFEDCRVNFWWFALGGLVALPGAPAKPMEKQRCSPPTNLVFRYQKQGF